MLEVENENPDGRLDEIKLKLEDYLIGKISFSEFHKWLVPVAWDMDSDFVNEMKLRIAEYTSGHWTEQELRQMFASMV